ncbi:MAG: hypothetical protein RLZZ488_2354 [Pseudomonadota bacterium]|jgi:hypothetical protein
MKSIPDELKKLQESLSDVARIGQQEVIRGVEVAKRQLSKMQQLNRRKELFAELGRSFYDWHEDGLPEPLRKIISETELSEIITEIREIDEQLSQLDSTP